MQIVRTSIRLLRTLLISFALLYLVVTFTPIVRYIALATDQEWYDGNGDVLVVLGGSMLVSGDAANATMGTDTYLRCVYASWIIRQRQFADIVVTGDDGAAEAMARYLEQNGRGSNTVFIENRANSTYQNALFTRNLLAQHYNKLPEVVVLTSDYHSWRARRVFEHAGFEVRTIPIPDVIKQSSFPSRRWPAFLTLLNEFAKDAVYFAQGRIT